jgi:hypothetical protein
MNPILIRKTLIASSVALALGTPIANAALVTNVLGPYTWSTDRANFTFLSAGGYLAGLGTNDVSMTWDGNAYNASSDYTGPGGPANITASSTTAFFGYTWVAHDIQVFTPGSYTFDVTLDGGNPEGLGFNAGARFMNVTVGTGQLGMHMLFDWSGENNIDMFVVMTGNSVFGSGVGTNRAQTPPCSATTKNCLWTGKGWVGNLSTNAPSGNQKWMLASVDGNGDGVMGIPMAAGGPFAGFNANFNANMVPTPVPSAVWLFGSGLMGLLAVLRRRNDNGIKD